MNQVVRTEAMQMSTRFSPDDSRAFRDALGQFATGVTVVSAMTDEGPVGMTANSFSSVSLDPPLVLWSIANTAARYDVFAHAPRFGISVLAAHQKDLALAFARDGQSFTEENSILQDGLPMLRDALAGFECDLHETHAGGDHRIVVGRVTKVTLGADKPLVFHRGGFGSFAAT